MRKKNGQRNDKDAAAYGLVFGLTGMLIVLLLGLLAFWLQGCAPICPAGYFRSGDYCLREHKDEF